MKEMESAGCSAAIQQDHIHSVVSDGSDGVNEWFCNYPARSRTSCGSAMGETEPVSGSAAIQQDHVQTVDG
jgi:hypothetical protein